MKIDDNEWMKRGTYRDDGEIKNAFGRRERKIEGEGHISPKWRIIEGMEGFFLSYCLV